MDVKFGVSMPVEKHRFEIFFGGGVLCLRVGRKGGGETAGSRNSHMKNAIINACQPIR